MNKIVCKFHDKNGKVFKKNVPNTAKYVIFRKHIYSLRPKGIIFDYDFNIVDTDNEN